tara:strand:- start:1615 stop:2076 length:462 start_codon:yes stop_codon:yes gene_type:complete
MGWSMYFAFIMAATNTLVVTYYLAIEKIPELTTIFPSFTHYVLIIISCGIPLLITVGYSHWKRTGAYRTEMEVNFESNPFQSRMLVNSEINLKLNLKVIDLVNKISNNEKIDDAELKKLVEFQNELKNYLDTRREGKSGQKDLNFFRKIETFD